MKKALVIGGTGPTGPYIVQGLQGRGYEVTVLNRGKHEVVLPGVVNRIIADPHFSETLAEALKGLKFDVVLATYGRIRLLPDVCKEVTDRLITVGGTAYAPRQAWAAHETSPISTSNNLLAKMALTEEVLMKAHADGIYNVTHFRYPNLFGPRQIGPREWSVVRRILDGRPFVPVIDGGLSCESRAFSENAAYALLLAVDQPDASEGQIYNVCDDWAPSDADRITAIAEHMGKEIGLLNMPREVGRPAYFFVSARELDYGRAGQKPTNQHELVDSSKIRRELGYKDIVPFEEAMGRTVDWLLANKPTPGGEMEQQIGDPFDYAAEDKFSAALNEFVTRADAIEFSGIEYVHGYAHPKQPEVASSSNLKM